MNITKEIVSKLIFGISMYRHWEKEYDKEPGAEVKQLMFLWRTRIDELIEQLDATEYKSLKDLISEIQIVRHADKLDTDRG